MRRFKTSGAGGRGRRTAAALAVLALPALSSADPLLTYRLKIKGQLLRVEVASDEPTRRTGLMFRRSLPENGGMLFVYAQAGRWAMWMRNTYVPLSVAFIDPQGRILNIEDMQPLTEDAHQAAGPAKYALEVRQGWFKQRGIQPGDRVEGLDGIPAGR